jgi:hypothetical protein
MNVVVLALALVACKSKTETKAETKSETGGIHAEQSAMFRRGFGAEPATPGEIFDGHVPGGPEHLAAMHAKLAPVIKNYMDGPPSGDNPQILAMLGPSRVVVKAEALHGKITQLGLWFNDERDTACPADLFGALEAAWKSAPSKKDENEIYWTNAQRGFRARVKTGDQCRLEFEQYLPIDAWLAAAIKPELVGTKVDALVAALGARAERRGTELVWTELGVGFGLSPTYLTAKLTGDTITGLEVTTFTSSETFDALVASLRAKHGEPTEASAKRVAWTAAKVSVDYEDWRLALNAGSTE